jgi:hemerythrin
MDINRSSFETGIPVIDRQHIAYIDMVERLIGQCKKGILDPGQIHSEVKEVVWYALEHFNDEELLMRSANYPTYSRHLEKHNQFRSHLDGFLKLLKNEGIDEDYGVVLTNWLVGWLEHHVQEEDALLAAFLKVKKRKPWRP